MNLGLVELMAQRDIMIAALQQIERLGYTASWAPEHVITIRSALTEIANKTLIKIDERTKQAPVICKSKCA